MQLEDIESLDTPEVEKMLQEELSREDTNADLVRQLAQVLKNRDMANNAEVSPEVQALFDQFVERGRRNAEPKKYACRRWVPRAICAMLTFCLLVSVIPMEVQAETWRDRIARWSDSVFSFFDPTEKVELQKEYVFRTDNPGLQEVYDKVEGLGITEHVVPMWIPDGLRLTSCEVVATPTKTGVCASFTSGDDKMVLRIAKNTNGVYADVQKNKVDVTEYEISEIDHMIMQNYENWVICWINNGIECSASINCSEDDVYKIINSIYSSEVA